VTGFRRSGRFDTVRGRGLLAVALLAALSVPAGAAPATAAPATAAVTSIDVYAIGDFHGRLESNGESAGIAVLGAFLADARRTNPASLVVSTGDNVGGSPFLSAASGDQITIDLLEEVGLDATAVGANELRLAEAELAGAIADADFPFLAANLYCRTTGNRPYPAYSVQSVDGGDDRVRLGDLPRCDSGP
jgi:5'-nucleotidase